MIVDLQVLIDVLDYAIEEMNEKQFLRQFSSLSHKNKQKKHCQSKNV